MNFKDPKELTEKQKMICYYSVFLPATLFVILLVDIWEVNIIIGLISVGVLHYILVHGLGIKFGGKKKDEEEEDK